MSLVICYIGQVTSKAAVQTVSDKREALRGDKNAICVEGPVERKTGAGVLRITKTED